MTKLARAAFPLALLGLAFLVLGPLLAYLGLIPPLAGFGLFALHLPMGLLGLVFGVLGVIANFRAKTTEERVPRAPIGAGLGLALMALVPFVLRPPDVPSIHDISTDLEDAPEFTELALVEANVDRDLTFPHGGAATLDGHREAYGDLRTLELDVKPGDVLVKAGLVAQELGWQVVATDAEAGRLEATHTSGIFRFVDDIVVRVRPLYEEKLPVATMAEESEAGASESTEAESAETVTIAGATTDAAESSASDDGLAAAAPAPPRVVGSLVDVRSTSRVGQSDLGANAARIREFLGKLRG